MSVFTSGTRFVAPLLFVVVVLACGGGSGDAGITNPPPPPPPALVVTTVEVTPPTPSITADETVQLTAIVKDQNGTAMSGRVVAWSSANVSVATVAASGLVTGIVQGQTTILASVDGKQGSAQLTVATRPRITLDATTAKVASVGPAGGSLTTTSTAGITYVLEIPERALETPVSISITPLSEFRQLPYSGGAVGAVELAPAGLRFARPAILHIKTLPNVGAGLTLVAMYYDGDGARVVPGPAARGSGEVVVLIPQIGIVLPASSSMSAGRAAVAPFALAAGSTGGGTGAGAALATPQDLSNTPWPPTSSAEQLARGQLAGLSMPQDQAAIVAAMHTWYQSIAPLITAARTDLMLRDALIEYTSWDAEFFLLSPNNQAGQLVAALTTDIRAGETALLSSFRFVSNNLNLTCVSTRSLVAANNILELYQSLQDVDRLVLLETPGTGYPEDDVYNDLCIQLVVTDSTLANPLQKNVSASVNLRFGIMFGTYPNVSATVPFALDLTLFGTTQDGTTHVLTDLLGKFNTSLTATGTNNVIVSVTACIDRAAGLYLDVSAWRSTSRGIWGEPSRAT